METQRLFTRDQVEQWFLHAMGASGNYEVKAISLLPGLAPPAWLINYEAIMGTMRYSSQCIVYQESLNGQCYLYFSVEKPLPSGMANADEEDAAIAQREAEERAEWLRRHEEHAE